MPSITKRKYMYDLVTVDGVFELDYLSSPLTIIKLNTTKVIMITRATEYRPDLVSLKEFGTYDMGWLISLHNDFLDPIYDYEIGKEVKIPNLDQYYRYYNRHSRRRR